MRRILLMIILTVFSVSANSATLHFSTWEDPFTPTYTVVFGSPEIVGPTGFISSNSLAFNTLGNNPDFYYDQILYDISSAESPLSSLVNVSFDIAIDSLIGTSNQFVVVLDTPTVRNLYFTGQGNIEIGPGWAPQQILTTYSENVRMHVGMEFDIDNNIWNVSLNDTLIYSSFIDNTSNPFLQPAEYLRSVRFSHGLTSSSDLPNHASTVFLDNVLIATVVPVPAGIYLFVSGLFCVVLQAHSKFRR